MRASRRNVRVYWLGRRRYEPTHELQKALAEARLNDGLGDVVLLVEHDPVITLGRGAKAEHVLLDVATRHEHNVDIVTTGRGGDVTYHGPGQLVGYPILQLKPERCDVRRYVRSLAEIMILIARERYVEAGIIDDKIGVWADTARPAEWGGEPWATQPAKLGAIGVRISRWVTMHGFALNVTVDLGAFGWIVPCGIRSHGVTSIQHLTGHAVSLRDLALSCARPISQALDVDVVGEIRDVSKASELDVSTFR